MPPDDDAPQPSLWHDLAGDRAGTGVRVVVAVALAACLTGVGLVASYVLAALVPPWNRSYYYNSGGGGTYPRDELIAVVMTFAGCAWVAAVAWLFVRSARRPALVRPFVATGATAVATVLLCVLADDSLRGEQEYVVTGLGLVGAAVVLVIWLQAARQFATRRPMRHHLDQLPDVRCPACGYRMVGLHEARCPECGTGYTLDELIARQGFLAQASSTPGPPLPPVPTSAGAADPWATAGGPPAVAEARPAPGSAG